MPSERLKLTSIFIAIATIAMIVAACGAGTKHHTWQAEFDERLEGSVAAIEERLGEFRSSSSQTELFEAGMELGPRLEFKGELIRSMDPPDGCEAVQEKGRQKVERMAGFSYDMFKNLTPLLHEELPRPLQEAITEFGEVEREAESCASG